MKQALIVIDVQNIYTSKDSELYVKSCGKVLKNINNLITHFLKNNELIVYVKHQHNADLTDTGRMFDYTGQNEGAQFIKGEYETAFDKRLNVVNKKNIIVKTRYDAFEKTKLNALLKNHGVDKVVICGFMTNYCCESTARTAHDKDYFVDFILDATGTPGSEMLSPNKTIKATALTLANGFAIVKTTDEFLKGSN